MLLLIIVLVVLRLTGVFGSKDAVVDTVLPTNNGEVVEVEWEAKEEITEDDLEMIEDFLDEIVEAVEKEEAIQ